MKKPLIYFGVLFCIIGLIWVLQGINILPGSFMTGQIKWAWYGGLTILVGLILLFVSRLRK